MNTMSLHRGHLWLAVLAAAGLGIGGWLLVRGDALRPLPSPVAHDAHRSGTSGGSTSADPIGASSSTRAATATPDLATQTTICVRPDGNVATVDGEAIAVARLCGWLARIGAVRPGGADRKQARVVLDRMIDAVLVARALRVEGAIVSDAEVDKALAALAGRRLDPELLKTQIRERLELEKLAALRVAREVSDAEVDAEIASGAPGIDRGQGVNAEAWVLRVPPGGDAERAEQAARAFASAVGTTAPEVAARQHGLSHVSAFVLTANGVEPELEDTALALSKGQWSGAIRTKIGWTVLRVLGHVEEQKLDAAALRTRVRSAIATRKLQAAAKELREKLRAAATIEVLVDL